MAWHGTGKLARARAWVRAFGVIHLLGAIRFSEILDGELEKPFDTISSLSQIRSLWWEKEGEKRARYLSWSLSS